MAVQQSLEFGLIKIETKKPKKKRIRYKTPTYTKFYCIWRYDRDLFRQILNFKLKGYKCAIPFDNQEDIVKQCLLLDKKGSKERDCDEKHIFRIGVLEKIHAIIFSYTQCLPVNSGEAKPINKDGLIIYPDCSQAEIENTWQMPIKERVKIHIKLLRLLREGFSIKESMTRLK